MKRSRHQVIAQVSYDTHAKLISQIEEYRNKESCPIRLGEIAKSIYLLEEYFIKSGISGQIQNKNEILLYFKSIYDKQCYLVLDFKGNLYSYTRKDIIYYMRGIVSHADAKKRKDNEKHGKKENAFLAFLYEEDAQKETSAIKFAVSLEFVLVIQSKDVNHSDTITPFQHRISINGIDCFNRSWIDSMVANIACEYLSIYQDGKITFTQAVLIPAKNRQEMINVIENKDIGSDIWDTLLFYMDKSNFITQH